MKLRIPVLCSIPVATLVLTQCVVEVDNPGNLPAQGTASAGTTNSSAVPAKVTADCLATLRTQIPDRGMRVVRAEMGEASYIVDVQVDGVPNLWRCYHDGTRCTGTEYQGEG